jgi:type II secretory pathway component HofQ
LEGTTDTTVLANPKVLALNKQKGEVIVGNETGYLTTTTTETSSTQTIEFLKTGTRLVFRPFIADDGYIRMEVHPEDSSGGLQTAANLPFKTTTEVTSNVMIKDGHTIVIGGLFRESSSSTKSQVPVLGNIPLVGTLFRNQSDATRRQEIIIMLTPHIIKDDDVMSELAEKAMKDGERLRVGVRRGMMFWGRERLADMFYQTAVDEMAKSHPDRSKALWNLDAAINLCPTMSEAHQLRQELTGKEITTADGSAIRTFVKRAILADHVASTQPSLAEMEAAEAAAEVARAATQPALADAATSQPTNVADAATSQPSEQSTVVTDDVAMAEPTTGTTTQPANVAGATPTEQYEEVAGADKTTVPTTGPSNSKDDKSTTVTELPTEELPAATGDKANDANK